jgi:hypothetical protein
MKSKNIKDLLSLKWLKKDKVEDSLEITGPTGFQRNVHVSIDDEGDISGYDAMIKEVEASMNLDTATWEKLMKLKKEQILPSVNEKGEKQTTIKPRSEEFKKKNSTGTPIIFPLNESQEELDILFTWIVQEKKKEMKLFYYPETKLVEIQTEEYFSLFLMIRNSILLKKDELINFDQSDIIHLLCVNQNGVHYLSINCPNFINFIKENFEK